VPKAIADTKSKNCTNELKKIPLQNGLETLVDDNTFGPLNKFRWYAKKSAGTYYVCRFVQHDKKRKIIFMHRMIMKCPLWWEVHHKNHNPLDNRRKNLIVLSKEHHKMLHMSREITGKIEHNPTI